MTEAMTEATIPTQPLHPRLAAAVEALLGVLAGDPQDWLVRGEVGVALVELSAVDPPYPPHPEPVPALPVAQGLTRALAELRAAAVQLEDPVEGLRVAFIARELQDALLRRPP